MAPVCAGVPLSPTPSNAGSALPPGDDRLPVLEHGRSLTPMTPKRPPKGMVLPNAFGLLSMQSFKKAGSGADDTARCPSVIEEVRGDPIMATTLLVGLFFVYGSIAVDTARCPSVIEEVRGDPILATTLLVGLFFVFGTVAATPRAAPAWSRRCGGTPSLGASILLGCLGAPGQASHRLEPPPGMQGAVISALQGWVLPS